jgi:vacuolar-type H+-ATPase subunit C/Vma6
MSAIAFPKGHRQAIAAVMELWGTSNVKNVLSARIETAKKRNTDNR